MLELEVMSSPLADIIPFSVVATTIATVVRNSRVVDRAGSLSDRAIAHRERDQVVAGSDGRRELLLARDRRAHDPFDQEP